MTSAYGVARDATDGEGDCYEAAAHLFISLPAEVRANARLCHGKAIGTGGDALGLRFGHAWVEQVIFGAHLVRDNANGHDYLGPAERYYAVGQVHDVQTYTYGQMLRMLAKHQHYGPWPEQG